MIKKDEFIKKFNLKVIKKYIKKKYNLKSGVQIEPEITKELDEINKLAFNDISNEVLGKETCDDFIIALKSLGILSEGNNDSGIKWSYELFGESIVEFNGISCQLFANGKKVAVVGQIYDSFYNKLKECDFSIRDYQIPAITSCRIDYNAMKNILYEKVQSQNFLYKLAKKTKKIFFLPSNVYFNKVGESFLTMKTEPVDQATWNNFFLYRTLNLAIHMRRCQCMTNENPETKDLLSSRFIFDFEKKNTSGFVFKDKIEQKRKKGYDAILIINCSETFTNQIYIDHEDLDLIKAISMWLKSVQIYLPGKFPYHV